MNHWLWGHGVCQNVEQASEAILAHLLEEYERLLLLQIVLEDGVAALNLRILLVVFSVAIDHGLNHLHERGVVPPAVLQNYFGFPNVGGQNLGVYQFDAFGEFDPEVDFCDLVVIVLKAEQHVVHQLSVFGLEQQLVVLEDVFQAVFYID